MFILKNELMSLAISLGSAQWKQIKAIITSVSTLQDKNGYMCLYHSLIQLFYQYVLSVCYVWRLVLVSLGKAQLYQQGKDGYFL